MMVLLQKILKMIHLFIYCLIIKISEKINNISITKKKILKYNNKELKNN